MLSIKREFRELIAYYGELYDVLLPTAFKGITKEKEAALTGDDKSVY